MSEERETTIEVDGTDLPANEGMPSSSTEIETLHAKGLWLARQRRFDEAVELFNAALGADPGRADAIRHLAQAYSDSGRLGEAESAWLRYLAARPESADGHRYLGNVRKRLEKTDLAVESLQKAAVLDGQSAPIHVDLGIVLVQVRKLPEAKQAFLRAKELQPDSYDAHLNLGMLLQEMKDSDGAVAHLRRAIELRPDDPNGHNNLGVAFAEQGKYSEAIACYESLVAKSPDYPLAWNNLGNALRTAGRVEEAKSALNKALEIKPDYAEAHNNLGIIHTQLEEFDEALRSYDRSLLLRPDYSEAHANRGLVYLLMGNFQQGWADYEWRWQSKNGLKRRNYSGKVWDGSPLAGKRILLYYEQGLGDTFQFIRYAKDLKNRGATVVFECQPNMRQILLRTPGIDEFVIRGEKPPAVDFYTPLLSLPGLCQTNLENLPRRVPYVFADPAVVWDWKQRMASLEGFQIGIVWQGNPEHKGDRNRSIPLKCFAPLANIPGVKLITLQKNTGSDQITELNGSFSVVDYKGTAEDIDGWLRTAAIISNLDLVISADTSVIHLAGAMGVPVWTAISMSPDWRWLLNRDDTPWYPTMRLFRQKRLADWPGVFEEIAEALRERLSLSKRTAQDPASELDRQSVDSLLQQAGDYLAHQQHSKAQPLLERAVQLDPCNAKAQQDLGVTYAKQGRLREAIDRFRRALELTPDSAGLYANLGLACYHARRLEEAVSHLRKAIWLGASSADTHKNLGRALADLPDPAAAEESYWAALRLKPDDAEAHYHLARSMLTQGKYEQGWLEYEWRWRWQNIPKRHMDKPRWVGQDLNGKRLLIFAENDPRDTLQFARYADLISQRGGRVILQCQPFLTKIMAGCLGVEEVIPFDHPLPNHDLHAALLTLPATFGTTLQTIPAARPYLGIASRHSELWRERFLQFSGSKIGLALNADEGNEKKKAHASILFPIFLQHFEEFADVTVFNLEPHERDASWYAPLSVNHSRKNLDHLKSLRSDSEDSAERWASISAALSNIDLLITVDNTIAHIAGALGIPTWIVLPASPEPRWLLGRDDTPWYPTMRLFRQRHQNDWNEVVGRVMDSLQITIRKSIEEKSH